LGVWRAKVPRVLNQARSAGPQWGTGELPHLRIL